MTGLLAALIVAPLWYGLYRSARLQIEQERRLREMQHHHQVWVRAQVMAQCGRPHLSLVETSDGGGV